MSLKYASLLPRLGNYVHVRGNNLKGLKDFCLKAKARIWPCLSYVCHIRARAVLVLTYMNIFCVSSDHCVAAKIPPTASLPRLRAF